MEMLAGLIALAFGGLWVMVVMLGAGLGLAGTALWIWMLVEVLTRETDENNTKLIWVLVIILTGWIGGLIYLFVRRPERIKTRGK